MNDGDAKESSILGRTVRWTNTGIEYEADPKHRKIVMEYFGFEDGSKPLTCNGEKDDREEAWEQELLPSAEAIRFRGLAARLNFLSLDRPDLQYPVKQCSQEMARPTRGSWKRMKKIARYLIGSPSVIWMFP